MVQKDLEKALKLLKSGELVAIPTETVYGLAAPIDNEGALKKIFATKERPFFDPLIVHISNLNQKNMVIDHWPKLADLFAKTFWPGPLTIILPKHNKLNPLITAGGDFVGIRMPNHPMTLELIERLGVPLAAPSANKFGKTSPTTAAHVQEEFPNLFVLDGGQTEIGIESTVLSIEEKNNYTEVKILRPGKITESILKEATKNYHEKIKITLGTSEASPGQLKQHYMPKIPFYIIEKNGSLDLTGGVELKLNPDANLAARELYEKLRSLSNSGAKFIYLFKNKIGDSEFWQSIWNRLQKAASPSPYLLAGRRGEEK